LSKTQVQLLKARRLLKWQLLQWINSRW